jgi:hypothetical protein
VRPAVGTWCVDCRRKGHNCQSQIFIEDYGPLCLDCDNLAPCSFERVGAQATGGATEDMWGEPLPGPVKSLPVVLRALFDNPKEEAGGRWRAALGPQVAEDLIAEAHDDREAGKHLQRKPVVQKQPKQRSPIADAEIGDRIRASMAESREAGVNVGRPSKPKENRKVQDAVVIPPHIQAQVRADLATMTIEAVAKKHRITWYFVKKIALAAGIAPKLQHPVKHFSKPKPVPHAPMKEVLNSGSGVAGRVKVLDVNSEEFKREFGPTTQEYTAAERLFREGAEQSATKCPGCSVNCCPEHPREPSVPTATVNGFEFTPPPIIPPEAMDRPPITKLMNADELKMWDEAPKIPLSGFEIPDGFLEQCDLYALCVKPKGHKPTCQDADGKWIAWPRPDEVPAYVPKPPAQRVSITVELSEADAVAMFAELSVDHKAQALRTVLEATWRR